MPSRRGILRPVASGHGGLRGASSRRHGTWPQTAQACSARRSATPASAPAAGGGRGGPCRAPGAGS